MDHSDHTLLQAGSQTAISDRMRELLARAAQDHVYEQRTQGAVLDEIRQRLEGMEWLLREVRERELGGLSGTLESVHGRLDDIAVRPPAWAEGLAQHVEAVRDHVDAVGERVGSLGQRVDSVRDRVTPVGELPSLWADIGTVGESVDEALVRLQSITDGTRGVGDRVGDAVKRLGQIQANMEAAAGRFTRLDRSLADLGQRAERLESGMLDLSASVREAVGDAAGRLLAAVEQVNGKVDLLDERLDDVEGRVTGRVDVVDSRLCALDGHVEKIGLRLEGVDDRVEAVDQRVGRLPAVLNISEIVGAQTDDHARRFAALDERVVQSQAALLPLADMLGAQPDREQLAEALSETMEPTRADLTRRLGALEETMLALAEVLLRPTRNDKD
ncbi:hypothetical protein [Streptosporangium roseum]|uniref:Uncharacterized protein n=1 Tax=Streptosporangium roseum (strain ATCC 12428 / DSM 43021 / JCM 3005 / KCTC 9067 / NCIMB 10171 / NRRL 2505 / NI 9100) TaxID=479432 RepID=D2BBC7_STRRD|nr:hypothetical protein [Streptosporangium roseum]ACZ84150.1 hypothetical protein Sros_1151 [Streptosporangium roseum DSM 43021]